MYHILKKIHNNYAIKFSTIHCITYIKNKIYPKSNNKQKLTFLKNFSNKSNYEES